MTTHEHEVFFGTFTCVCNERTPVITLPDVRGLNEGDLLILHEVQGCPRMRTGRRFCRAIAKIRPYDGVLFGQVELSEQFYGTREGI